MSNELLKVTLTPPVYVDY